MRSVLLVDDEPRMLRVLKLGLENAGYEVETASDGAEALSKLRERSFSVMVTDLNMPRMGGRELCESLRREPGAAQPLIFVLTGRPGEGHRRWAGEIENVEFVEKPASVRLLVERMGERLAEAAAPREPGR